jgi:pimeloyl-ACP methyl ester carboxylesterase
MPCISFHFWRRASRAAMNAHLFRLPVRLVTTLVIACTFMSIAAAGDFRYNIVLVHGMRSTPKSLNELRRNLIQLGYRVISIDYNLKKTCAAIAESVRINIDAAISKHKLNRSRTYVYGYSLGGMAVAQSNVNVGGVILDAPSNYPNEACADLLNYLPLSANYPKKVLEWRHQSNNISQATEAFSMNSSQALIIGHSDDFMSPRKTILAYARATHSSVWWVSGDHSTSWGKISQTIHGFISTRKPGFSN